MTSSSASSQGRSSGSSPGSSKSRRIRKGQKDVMRSAYEAGYRAGYSRSRDSSASSHFEDWYALFNGTADVYHSADRPADRPGYHPTDSLSPEVREQNTNPELAAHIADQISLAVGMPVTVSDDLSLVSTGSTVTREEADLIKEAFRKAGQHD